MSSWEIKYSDKARTEIDDIFDYIADDLHEPLIAKNLVQLIFKEIRSLESMPGRYRLYEDEPWHSYGLRVLPVKKYICSTRHLPIRTYSILTHGRPLSAKP